MRPSYARAIPRPWQRTARIFVALGDPHRQRIVLMFEPGERLTDAAVRETLEETAWTLRPTALLGAYRWQAPKASRPTLRFAFVGDVVIAEPKALVGFAGPRVIENTVREKLPEGFQRSEFLLEHGAVDLIIDRRELRARLGAILAMLSGRPQPLAQAEAAV